MATESAQPFRSPTIQQSRDDGKTQTISGYEQFREERIKENLERMQKLGILDLSLQVKAIKSSSRSTRSTRKTPQRFSPLPPPGPTRRSSRLQNATPVSYSEVDLTKKDKSLKVDGDLLEEGARPEIYTEEHEKLLGSTEQTWTLFVDGCGKDGKRIYDPVNGKTCHQCRQKTLGHRTHCSKCNMVQGQFCGDCLYMRYGEHVLEAKQNPNWICPVCRGICNCSLCRQGKGWLPTGALYRKISSLGYKSVAHYLIETRRERTGPQNDLSTKVPLSAKRSLPFTEMEEPSQEEESSKLNGHGGLANHHSGQSMSVENLNEEIKQETNCSPDEQGNCKASENTAQLIQKPAIAFDCSDNCQGLPRPGSESNGTELIPENEKGKGLELLLHNEDNRSIKKREGSPVKAVLTEPNEDPVKETPGPEEDKNISTLETHDAPKKRRACAMGPVNDSVAGRLRKRRGRN